MIKQKNKKQKSAILGARNSQRTKTLVIVSFFILTALFSPLLMGRFQTKAVGTKLPGIWYDTRTGHYKSDVMALGYWGIPNDPATPLDESLFNREFNYAGDTAYVPFGSPDDPPGVVQAYNGCSSFMSSLGVFFTGQGATVVLFVILVVLGAALNLLHYMILTHP